MHDQVYFKTGVENEEFENALMYFVLNQDPEVQAMMKRYMEKMQKELASAESAGAKWLRFHQIPLLLWSVDLLKSLPTTEFILTGILALKRNFC